MITERMKQLAGITLNEADTKAQEEFGNHLFGEFTGKEKPDTPKEQKLYDALQRWVDASDDKKGEILFKELMPFKSDYPEVLDPGSIKLYRGTVVKLSDFKKKMGVDISKFTVQDINFNKPVKGTYKPTSEYQSWANEFNVAMEFALNSNKRKKGYVAVVIKVENPKKNSVLFNPNFMSQISNMVVGGKESEVIHEGKSVKADIIIIADNNTKDTLQGVISDSDSIYVVEGETK